MTKKAYREKCIACIKHKDHRNKKRMDIFYYEDAYAIKIKDYFEKRGIKSLETNYNKKSKTTSICSFLSSGRFCYNYFRSKEIKTIEFETPIYNDLPTAKQFPTKMDAVDPSKNRYYECKCDEITAKHHDLLSTSYRDNSKLFSQFGINNIVKEHETKKGRLSFPASALVDFGSLVDEHPEYKDCCYNELRFDLKQFICHLIALAGVDGHKELIYVVFVPDKDKLDEYPALMKKEMQCIKSSKKIVNFLDKHDISFSWEFVSIGDVKDINYLETYGQE